MNMRATPAHAIRGIANRQDRGLLHKVAILLSSGGSLWLAVLPLCSLLVVAVGCATVPPADSPQPTLTEKREKNVAARIRRFEANRAFAEHQAALARWNRGDMKGARQRLEELLSRNPNHVEARLLLADVYLSEDRCEEAASQVRQALAVDPRGVEALYMMGLVLDIAGETTEAMSYYARAAELDPHSAAHAAADGEAGAIAPRVHRSRPERTDEARSGNAVVLAAPTHRVEDDGPLPVELVSLEEPPELTASEPRDTPRAKRLPPKPIVVPSPDDAAVVLPPKSDFEDAQPLDRAPEPERDGSSDRADSGDDRTSDHPSAETAAAAQEPHNRRIPILAAVESLRRNQPELAVELLTPWAHRGEGSARLYRVLGTAHYRLGDFGASETALRQALSLDKSSALTYFLMGCTLAKLGESDAAEDHFRQAATLDPGYAARR